MATHLSRLRPTPLLAMAIACALVAPPPATAHGDAGETFEATIHGVEPRALPIEFRISDGDLLRVENEGDEELLLCGYVTTGCEPYARIGPDGVYENHNSRAWFANQDEDEPAPVPEGAGEGAPDWQLVRREPAFFEYHDHRIHWMGGERLPPGVDDSSSERQKVADWTIEFRYGETDGELRGQLDYLGQPPFLERWGEYLLTGSGVLAMLVVFALDARRRRRERRAGAATATGTAAAADPGELQAEGNQP